MGADLFFLIKIKAIKIWEVTRNISGRINNYIKQNCKNLPENGPKPTLEIIIVDRVNKYVMLFRIFLFVEH